MGVFSWVNESVWKYFTLGVWPVFFFGLIEHYFLKDCTNNLVIAKAIQVLLIPILIYVLFNFYTSILGRHILIIDIGIFIVSVIVSYMVSYKILSSNFVPSETNYINSIGHIANHISSLCSFYLLSSQ